MGPDAMIFIFWMLSFKATFSLSSFTFIKRLFSSSSLSAIKGGVICISEVIDISPSNLDSSLCFIQPCVSHNVLCISKWYIFIVPWRRFGQFWGRICVSRICSKDYFQAIFDIESLHSVTRKKLSPYYTAIKLGILFCCTKSSVITGTEQPIIRRKSLKIMHFASHILSICVSVEDFK